MADEIKKFDLSSINISEEQLKKLKAVLPEVFTEGLKVDFDKLRQTIGTAVDTGNERYGMQWPGKSECFKLIQQQSVGTLKPCRAESGNFDTTENLFIEGDNLEVLKLLQKSYYGKVKMIYIDPPYNTGKEFIYPDKYSESIDTYLAYSGQIDNKGYKFSTNTETEGRFHSKWLNMMYPRLFLARNLLRDDGVIFISIDDNEVSNLRKLCDEIFGEECFIGEITWESTTQPDNIGKARFGLQKKVEFILFYSKCVKNNLPPFKLKSVGTPKKYPHIGKFGKCRFEIIERSYDGAYARPTMRFQILNQYPREGKQWQIGEETAKQLELAGKLEIVDGVIKRAIYPEEEIDDASYLPFWSHLSSQEYGTSQKGKATLNSVFDTLIGFETVKPIELLINLIQYFDENAIILDFFSGSATTAHAVLDLNKQDGGNRKFILVQLPEPCAPDSEAFKAGYKTIADIGKERIRRVIKKVDSEQWKVISKEEKIKYGCKELSRADCLAKVNGVVQADLFSGQETSERGTLQFVGSDAPGGSINSIEHSGRSSSQFNQRVSSVSGNSQGLKSGAGDSASSMCESEIPCRYGYFGSDAAITGDRENAGCSFKNTLHCPLSTNHSLDLGFKVFKLDKSNFKIWDGEVKDDATMLEQIEFAIDHIDPNSKPEDILYEILLKAGFELTTKIKEFTLAGKKVYSIEDNALLICLEMQLTKEVIVEMSKLEPARVVCLDAGFANNDQLKTNAVQIMKSHKVEDFRTV